MMKVNKFFRYALLLLLLIQAGIFTSCGNRKVADVQFSYRGIIDKEYRFNVGRVIPVTISQSIETDGDISSDGNYFFYSSNAEGGNFDIYLRSMGDITTVRLTSHPSKETNPVISPDGKRLAFISFRDDPEGDIFIMKLKPEDLLKKAAAGEELAALDSAAVNLTLVKQAETDVIINVKDAYPCWSPDGKLIAYSSSKDGENDIWVMDRDGASKRKVTSKGGNYPAFSPDGSRIIYVSYSENKNGDIYGVELGSGKTERLTTGDSIKLYPSYIAGMNRIIYSSISEDTNGNGSLDLQDRSVIRLLDLKSGLSYPLTKSSDTSFKAKWLPVLNTRDYSGVIIYTDVTGENINLNIIPETGIIPKKLNAKLQYELCESYISEYDDQERYAMSLESVFNFYGESGDSSSRAYTDRALKEAAVFYRDNRDTARNSRIVSFIKKRAEKKDLYASFILELISGSRQVKSDLIAKMAGDKDNKYFAPFAMEDLGDIAFAAGKKTEASSVYGDIIKKFPEFERSTDVLTKISLSTDDLRSGTLSDEAVKIINTGNTNQKISVTSNLVDPLQKGTYSAAEASRILKNISGLKTKFSSDKKIMAILNFASGVLNDSIKKTDAARADLTESINLSHPNDLTFYISNIRLAEMERRLGRSEEAEKYYSAGINRYSRRFKTDNFKDKLLWLISYYEQAGEKSSAAGNSSAAAQVYDKYINLVTLMHNKRLFPEIYAEYAPRAHVLYIDAYTAWKGEAGIDELEKSYNDKLPVLRMDFNRAGLYGLAYIYTKKAMLYDSQSSELVSTVTKDQVFENLYKADRQIEWALFIDDTFIEPYLLKSWIYQFVDLRRKETGGDIESSINGLFPRRLWEENITLLDRALNANNENLRPENEGNIHINMANSYFLLLNYPRALNHYRLAQKYKKSFGTDIERALFHFHFGYTLWQNGEIKEARSEVSKAYGIYRTISGGSRSKYGQQILTLYRYFALFSRYDEKYDDAIDWYRKILKLSEDTGIGVDRARYLQEIAFCYKEKGEFDTAKTYIEQADRLLLDYPDDTRKYYLRIRLFGIGPFPVWNMGPDTAVIGDNRIFYPLDTESKKLLSISMLEEMSVRNSSYSGAIEYLKKKISLLEKSKTSISVDTRIRSLNNLGYYYFRSGSINDAEKYFKEAGDLATEKNNLQGIFSSIMNLSNLYALMIEDGTGGGRDWLKLTSEFLSKIENYRNGYFDMKFAQEKEALEAAAEAKKLDVTPEQVESLKQRVEQQTADIYYELDTSIAVMKYYRAGLLYSSSAQERGDNPAYNLYAQNRDIYNLYADALRMFEGAISVADKQGKKEVKAKLLINAASCYEKTGEYEKAYVSLIDAKNISEQYRFRWTGICANYSLGRFISDYGKEVESGDYKAVAEKYLAASISRIEEHPLLYASRPGKIRQIYSSRIEYLINSGNSEKAFMMQDRLSRIDRITGVNSILPKFSNEYDSEKYYEYLAGISRLADLQERISSLLVSGALPASPEVEALNKKERQIEELLSRLFNEIKKRNSSIAPYIEPGEAKLNAAVNICSFMRTGKGIYSWKLSGGKIVSEYLKSDSADAVSSFIGGESANRGTFILLSDTAFDLIVRHRERIKGDFALINCIDRADDFSVPDYPSGKILSRVSGVDSPSSDIGIDYSENGTDFSGYSVIIDSPSPENGITPDLLFSRRDISPSVIICSSSDSASISLMLESALYAGTHGIIYRLSEDKKIISAILPGLYSGSGYSIASMQWIKAGNINTFAANKPSDIKLAADSHYAGFRSRLGSGDYGRAAVSLGRWSSLAPAEKLKYNESLWLMELLKGDYSGALKVLESYKSASPDEESGLKYRRIYTLLCKGDFAEAKSEKAKLAGGEKYSDGEFLEALFDSISGKADAAERILKIKKPFTSLLPAERYLILSAEYINLYNPEQGRRVIQLMDGKPVLSVNEQLMRFFIAGVKPEPGISPRVDRISSLNELKYTEMADESLKLIKSGESYDRLTLFPPMAVLSSSDLIRNPETALSFVRGLDLEKIAAASYTPEALAFLEKADSVLSASDRKSEKMIALALMKKISLNSSVFPVTKRSMYRIAMERMIAGEYGEALKEASAADERFMPEDPDYTGLQLLLISLEIRDGDYSGAESRSLALKNRANLKPEERYLLNLQLSMIELNRLRSLSKATPEDAVEFEKLFSSSLGFLKLDPGVLRIHGYREMTETVFDEFINYKMKTGQHCDAHYYNEMKKLIISSSLTGENFIKDAGRIDIDAIQQSLPGNCGYVNIAKVKNDIFIWLVDNKMKKALYIDDGYKTLAELMQKYRLASLQDSDVKNASSELQKFFEPLAEYFSSRKTILISPDAFTEKIPFEIIGKEKFLSEQAGLVYLASPLLLSGKSAETPDAVQFVGKSDTGYQSYIETVAARESGIKSRSAASASGGIAHITGSITYPSPEKGFLLDGVKFTSASGSADMLYATLDKYKGAGNLDFAINIKTAGVKSAVLNSSPVNDLNRGIFAGEFYRSLHSGKTVAASFSSALEKTRSDSRFRNPAAWSGFRLYIYNMNYLKE